MYLIVLLFSTSLWAQDLKVTYGRFQYALTSSETKVELTGSELNLTVEKAECNKKIFEDFKHEVAVAGRKMKIYKTKRPGTVKIEIDGKISYASRTTPEARYFLGVPDRFKKLKIENQLACKK